MKIEHQPYVLCAANDEIERLRTVLASVHASTDLAAARRRAYDGRFPKGDAIKSPTVEQYFKDNSKLRFGAVLRCTVEGEDFILARVGVDTANLIVLETGLAWTWPAIKYTGADLEGITKEEFQKLDYTWGWEVLKNGPFPQD